ncbi:MAG: Spo0E family sporulation regulatory protein-aspartic acid phosphatase, partial [Clostridiales bacterium]|nr:Spo0E family sporulation regulatory protein-aspartic acid phosphatase [Clostridiales bacterium]
MVIETESLKSRILKLQKDLGRIAANREDITSEDVLKLSRDLDDLIVEYTR